MDENFQQDIPQDQYWEQPAPPADQQFPVEQDQPIQQDEQVVPKRRLGRGLSALLGGGSPVHEPHGDMDASASIVAQIGSLQEIPIEQIIRNPNQPRKEFDEEGLEQLAESIGKHGVLQPLIVRAYNEQYEIIAGERRWLSSKKAGLASVPCQVVDVVDKTACEFAFEENLKRKDLSDLEKAQAFRDYLDLFQSTAEELANQLSLSRSAVSNTMRLLDLPVPVKNAMKKGKLSAGHARALLSLKDEQAQLDLAKQIQKEQLSVRKTETEVKKKLGKLPPDPDQEQPAAVIKPNKPELNNHLQSVQDQLRASLGLAVEIQLKTEQTGQVVFKFENHDEFERITSRFQDQMSYAA